MGLEGLAGSGGRESRLEGGGARGFVTAERRGDGTGNGQPAENGVSGGQDARAAPHKGISLRRTYWRACRGGCG